MAASVAVSTGPKKDNRGGAREGAGRKPQTLSMRQVQAMLDAADERAKKEKKTIDEILLDFIYDTKLTAKDRAACIKLFKDFSTAKISEGGETDTALGPAVYLPQQRPKLEVVK